VHSQACEVVTGYTREEFAADHYLWIRMVVPEDRDMVIGHVARILQGERVAPLEHRITRRDGRVRWVLDTTIAHLDTRGRLVSYDGVVNDITGRKEAEEALRQRDRQLVEAQKIAHLGFYDLDFATALWTSSEVLDEILGIDANYVHDIAGWISLIHPEDRQQIADYFRTEVQGRLESFNREYRIIRHADGRERWVHGMGVLQLGADGRPRRMFGTIHDISDRKRAEQLDLELERRLLHAQKLESLGVMAGGIAHDFNNLLMGITGNLEVALLKLGPSDARQSIEQAHQTACRAAELAGQMLAYSGRGLFVVSDLNLSTLVQENAQLLNLQLDRELPHVCADIAQFQQVVMNLISNASEASGEAPGVVTIATGVADFDREYLNSSVIEQKPAPGRFVWLEVADNGTGLDAETRQRMFDPFFSTKFTGRGLGLSAVLGIVKAHGGAIMVDSEIGRGTTVRVLLPAADC
jgi:PAS domain S-box-containing protein